MCYRLLYSRQNEEQAQIVVRQPERYPASLKIIVMSKAKRLKALKLQKEIKAPNYQGLTVFDVRNTGRVYLILKSNNQQNASRYFKPSHSMTGLSYNVDSATAREHRRTLTKGI